jgi:hypothetical protein
MDFTYGPALPLGMEARREVLEFRTGRRLEAAEFLRRVNRSLPPGVRFSSLEGLAPGAPSLANAIEKLVYSIDRASGDLGGPRSAAELKAALENFRLETPGAGFLGFALRGRRLVLTLPPLPTRGARVQDVVQAVFGVDEAAFLVRRDDVVLKN